MVTGGTPTMAAQSISMPLAQSMSKTTSFFNGNLQPTNSIYATKWHRVTAINHTIQTQYNPTDPVAHAALLNQNSAIQVSLLATATGTVGTGSAQVLTTTLTPNAPHSTQVNFAMPFISVYSGTQASTNNMLWPGLGANQTANQFTFQGGLDYDDFINTAPGSVISPFRLTIYNNGTTTGTYFAAVLWKWFNYNVTGVVG